MIQRTFAVRIRSLSVLSLTLIEEMLCAISRSAITNFECICQAKKAWSLVLEYCDGKEKITVHF